MIVICNYSNNAYIIRYKTMFIKTNPQPGVLLTQNWVLSINIASACVLNIAMIIIEATQTHHISLEAST